MRSISHGASRHARCLDTRSEVPSLCGGEYEIGSSLACRQRKLNLRIGTSLRISIGLEIFACQNPSWLTGI